MTLYKIVYDKDSCVGAGKCVEANPANWRLEDGKVVVSKTEIDDSELKSNLDAANSCPVSAIKIVNSETGEEIN